MNGWSYLNETWYIERSYASDLPFSIRIGSRIGGGEQKSWKTIRVERLGWTLVGRISKCNRFVIYVTGPALSGGVRGGSSALASLVLLDMIGQWQKAGMSGTCTNWLDKVIFSDLAIWGAEGKGKI